MAKRTGSRLMATLATVTTAAVLAASCAHGEPSSPPPAEPALPPPPPVQAAPVEPAATAPAVSGPAPVLAGAPLLTLADIATILAAPGEMDARHVRFALAVECITAHLGQPMAAANASLAAPCGGWSGPGCSSFTYGIEALKVAAPIAARLLGRSRDEIAQILVAAVSMHSVWHDAFGYVYTATGLGPGYAYAGCTWGPCAPDYPLTGQVDGIVYQAGRLLGVTRGPECGPTCAFAAPW